jgi:hypothetical protein
MFEIVSIFIVITLITMAEEKEDKNPVIATLHGVPIRRSNVLQIRMNESAYRDLIEQSFKTSLPMSKIVILRQQPCQVCGCDNVTVSMDVTKKKYDYRVGENGGNLVKNSNGKKHDDPGDFPEPQAQA